MPPQMAHTPQPPPPAEPTAEAPAAAAANRPGIRAQIAENPLTSLLGGIIIILLAATFATSNIRIDDTNDRITRLEDKIDTRFAAQDQKIDTKFAAQDQKIDTKFAAQDQKIDTKFAQVDARFAAQDQKIDARFDSLEGDVAEINLKLTALIAALNATDTVDAALEGRLTGADTADPADEAPTGSPTHATSKPAASS